MKKVTGRNKYFKGKGRDYLMPKSWKSSPYSEYDRYLFHQGTHFHSYQWLGAHIVNQDGADGVRFCVWAPNAKEIKVVGDFNDWNGRDHCMQHLNDSGIWALFVPGLGENELYKYQILTHFGYELLKADPYAFASEVRPGTASKVYCINQYQWNDENWQQQKINSSSYHQPMLIYEVHLGSWMQKDSEFLCYRKMAESLIPYVLENGYTHIELLPIVEHPYDGSWGYQATGYYAVTSRYGSPLDFMYLVDVAHQNGIGVILDWVPGHFCKDDHGLRLFDGTPQYEYADPLKQENHGWGTSYFDLGKPEIQSFLISNAVFWMQVFHIDGLRVDAVASMLYLDYGKGPGHWRPNCCGGSENPEAIAFLRKLNEVVFRYFPHALMIAEESTAWPLVSHPTYYGGLGFNYKWNMGWMNDMLRYLQLDPIYRRYHHNLVTFSFMYAFSENFILALSHDEVVHGKRSLLDKMCGDYWQKFATLRAFYGYLFAHPGKKLLFMGGDFGQFSEWQYQESLDWHLLEYQSHYQLQLCFRELAQLYKSEDSLWYNDHSWEGFEWLDPNDSCQSIISFIRRGLNGKFIIAVINFTPVVRYNYRIGVPQLGTYKEIFNTDDLKYGGSGQTNIDLFAESAAWHNRDYSIQLKIPPLAAVYLQPADDSFVN